MKKKINITTTIAIVLLAVAITFVLTSLQVTRQFNSKINYDAELISQLEKYVEAQSYVEGSFVGEYDESVMMDGAVAGMIQSLGDRWSYYMTAEEYETYLQRINNEYVGIGVVVQSDESSGYLLIKKAYPNSPAERAGIVAGDMIKQINGESLYGVGAGSAADMISGDQGTTVNLTVIKSDGSEVELTLTRESVAIDAVTSTITSGNIGIVTVANFDANVSDDFKQTVDSLINDGVDGIVFDVRGNPGGKLSELLSMLDLLLPEGTTFISRDKAGEETTYSSDASCTEKPMVVLVNADTYSAAEFFAAALQEYDWAKVIGVNTTGKGYSQECRELSDGSAIVLSTNQYFTPQGVSLAGVGVTPDYIVEMSDEATEQLYYGTLSAADDPQLQRALEVVAQSAAPQG